MIFLIGKTWAGLDEIAIAVEAALTALYEENEPGKIILILMEIVDAVVA